MRRMKKAISTAVAAGIALSAFAVCSSILPAAQVSDDEYLYGTTPMTFAEFWYGELETVPVCDSFDVTAPDLTTQSAEYLHYQYSSDADPDRFAGVQKNTWDNDSGEYDAITRATPGYGIFRAGFAHTVEVTRDDGTVEIYSSEIVEDENAPTGYTLQVNTTGVEGIVLSANTRIDMENSTNYTPDTNVTYAESIANGGAGYRILGLKSVPVKVKKSTVEAAEKMIADGVSDPQLDAFAEKLSSIVFTDDNTAYAYKELYASGVYGAREKNENAAVKSAGAAYLGNGENGTKRIAHGDGYADLTMFVYLDAYDGYTKGSLLSLDETTLDGLYADEESKTYQNNKESADKLAGFMHYALNYQGAKVQWAGNDNVFDTDDDICVGNMLHKDSYFSFNHGNYIEVSITNDFARFEGLGNGDYRITLISNGYEDISVEAHDIVLDYHAPAVANEDVPALAAGETMMHVAISAEGLNVSLDDAVQAAYAAGLSDPANYKLSYLEGSGRKAKEVVVAEAAAAVAAEGDIYTVSFDVSGAEALPEDIHYTITIGSAVEEVTSTSVEIHYAPKD